MNEQSQRYIANLAECRLLVNFRLREGMSGEQVLAQIREDASRLHALSVENNGILREQVFGKRPGELSQEDIADLTELADALFHYTRSADCGVAHHIHRVLLQDARAAGDRDRIIREAYFCGLTLHYMNIQILEEDYNLLGDSIHSYFEEGASYIDAYADITSEETRGFLIRCLGNLRLDVLKNMKHISQYIADFDRAMAVIESPAYHARSPQVQWADFAYSMHYDRLGLHVMPINESLSEACSQRVIRLATRSLRYVQRHGKQAQSDKDRLNHSRFSFTCMAIAYLNGLATIEEAAERILDIIEHADESDFSPSGITKNIGMLPYLYGYGERLSAKGRERLAPRIERAIAHAEAYVVRFPANEYIRLLCYNLRGIVRAEIKDTRLRQNLLHYIVACHSATYVHSRMVSFLTETLMERMIEVTPDALAGTLGLEDAQAVRAGRSRLVERARLCGLYHDLGKSMVLDSIGIYSRRLLDEEFLCIRQHSLLGKWLLGTMEGMEDCAQVALHHHRSYDGRSGYPLDCPPCEPTVARIAQIVAVADSLDAATDNVGRSYAVCKSFEQLCGELRQFSGTRYAPEVVRLFDDPAFFAFLRERLAQMRERVYVEVYDVLHRGEKLFPTASMLHA